MGYSSPPNSPAVVHPTLVTATLSTGKKTAKLVLDSSGGAALGFAHVGVIAVLDETCLHSGRALLFQRDNTSTAVRASSEMSAVFVTLDFARHMGAGGVLAVDISAPRGRNDAECTLQILLLTIAVVEKPLTRTRETQTWGSGSDRRA